MTEVLGEVIGISRHTRRVPPSSIHDFPVILVVDRCYILSSICEKVAERLVQKHLTLRVELSLSPSQFHTACRVSFAGLQQRRLPEASETQGNNADLEGIPRCSRLVILEPPDSEYCYLLTAIGMQLVDSWLQDMLPCES